MNSSKDYTELKQQHYKKETKNRLKMGIGGWNTMIATMNAAIQDGVMTKGSTESLLPYLRKILQKSS